jgi:hypothetical protein
MVLQERIELSTSPLPRECSTTELLQHPQRWRFCHSREGVARRAEAFLGALRVSSRFIG